MMASLGNEKKSNFYKYQIWWASNSPLLFLALNISKARMMKMVARPSFFSVLSINYDE
jgi:hypothetical protein